MNTPRRDLYAAIHKALRLQFSRTLTDLGSTDADDRAALSAALDGVEGLLHGCEQHLQHENAFLHPALERARPGSSHDAAADHDHHAEALADLRMQVATLRRQPTAPALARLYRGLAVFIAENLQHMQHEETVHNAVLWAAYSDAELLAIEQELVAHIPPSEMMALLPLMIPALNGAERAELLGAMKAGMPVAAFEQVMDIARRALPAHAVQRLCTALGLATVPGLVAA